MSQHGNLLLAVPILFVTGGVSAPLFVMDGRKYYVDFLWANPALVTTTVAAWGVVFYWLTRRAAAVLLLRGAGAKLKVADDPA